MFKKAMTLIGIYSFCVFIHKLNTAVAKAAVPVINRALDDIDPKKN